MNVTTTTPEFVSWLNSCQSLLDEDRKNNFPSLERVVLVVEEGTKFIRVIRTGLGASVFAFIAKSSFSNKSFGTVTAGDIYKPATYKAPAKHSRGSIFDSSNGMNRMTVYGPEYLR